MEVIKGVVCFSLIVYLLLLFLFYLGEIVVMKEPFKDSITRLILPNFLKEKIDKKIEFDKDILSKKEWEEKFKLNSTISIKTNINDTFGYCLDWYYVNNMPTMTFDEFKQYYELNPNAWSFGERENDNNNANHMMIAYRKSKAITSTDFTEKYSYEYCCVLIAPYNEYKKFARWRNREKIEAQKIKENNNAFKKKKEKAQKKIELLNLIQQDIDRLRKQSEQEIRAVQDIVSEVSKSDTLTTTSCGHPEIQPQDIVV